MKRWKAAAAVLMGAMLLAGCAGEKTEVKETVPEETKMEEPETAEAEAEGKQAILVVSFGTSYNDSRDVTIGAIEDTIAERFPEYEVRRAFTSQIIIDKLKERDNLEIDNVEEALTRAAEDGIQTLIVQPTHLMDGFEYTDLKNELEEYSEVFDRVVLSEQLLADDDDFHAVIDAVTSETESYDDGKTAICFMGHGTEAESNAVYAKLQDMLTEEGYENYFVGTVEAEPSLEDLIAAVTEKGKYSRVILKPLMVVAGDHANNDMAGDEEDSWKTQFEKAGFETECILEGLGQDQEIQEIYAEHVQAAIDSLAE